MDVFFSFYQKKDYLMMAVNEHFLPTSQNANIFLKLKQINKTMSWKVDKKLRKFLKTFYGASMGESKWKDIIRDCQGLEFNLVPEN